MATTTVIAGAVPDMPTHRLPGRRLASVKPASSSEDRYIGDLTAGQFMCVTIPIDIIKAGRSVCLGQYDTSSPWSRATMSTLAIFLRMVRLVSRVGNDGGGSMASMVEEHPMAPPPSRPRGRTGQSFGNAPPPPVPPADEAPAEDVTAHVQVFMELIPASTTETQSGLLFPLLEEDPLRKGWTDMDISDALRDPRGATERRRVRERQHEQELFAAQEQDDGFASDSDSSTATADESGAETGPALESDDDLEAGLSLNRQRVSVAGGFVSSDESDPELDDLMDEVLEDVDRSNDFGSAEPEPVEPVENETDEPDEPDEPDELGLTGPYSAELESLLYEHKTTLHLVTHSHDLGAIRFWAYIPNDLLDNFIQALRVVQETNARYVLAERERAARSRRSSVLEDQTCSNADVGSDPSLGLSTWVQIAQAFAMYVREDSVGEKILTLGNGSDLLKPAHPLNPNHVFAPERNIADPLRAYPRRYKQTKTYAAGTHQTINAGRDFTFPDDSNVIQLIPQLASVRSIFMSSLPGINSSPPVSRSGAKPVDAESALDLATLATVGSQNEYARDRRRFLRMAMASGSDAASANDTFSFAAGCEPGVAMAGDTDTMRKILGEHRQELSATHRRINMCPDIAGSSWHSVQRRRQLFFQMSLAANLRGASMWNRVAKLGTGFFPRPTEGVVKFLEAFAGRNGNSLHRRRSYAFSNLSIIGSTLGERMSIIEVRYKANTCHAIFFLAWLSNLNASDPNRTAKLHLIAYGDPATGKSYAFDYTIKWLPSEMCFQKDTMGTAKSAYAPVDIQRLVIQKDEMNPEVLGISSTGSYMTTPVSAEYKEQTSSGEIRFTSLVMGDHGRRNLVEYKRKNNAVHQGAMNDPITWVPAPVRSRFLFMLCHTTQRDDVDLAAQVCSEDSLDETRLLEDDIEGQQWENAMVHYANAQIDAGVLPVVQTPFSSLVIPIFLKRLRESGVPQPVGEARFIKRALAGARAMTLARAVHIIFGSDLSPLSPTHPRHQEALGVLHAHGLARDPEAAHMNRDPLDATQFQLMRPHMSDSADPAILVAIIGMLQYQWVQQFFVEVVEAIRVMFWPIAAKKKVDEASAEEEELMRDRMVAVPMPKMPGGVLAFPSAATTAQSMNQLDALLTRLVWDGPFVDGGVGVAPNAAFVDCVTGEAPTASPRKSPEKTAVPSGDVADNSHYTWTGEKTPEWCAAFTARELAYRRLTEDPIKLKCEEHYRRYQSELQDAREEKKDGDEGLDENSWEAKKASMYMTTSVESLARLGMRVGNFLKIPDSAARDVINSILRIQCPISRTRTHTQNGKKVTDTTTYMLPMMKFDQTKLTLSVLPQLFRDNVDDAILRALRAAIETSTLKPFVAVFGSKPGVYGHFRLVAFVPNPNNVPSKGSAVGISSFQHAAMQHSSVHSSGIGFAYERAFSNVHRQSPDANPKKRSGGEYQRAAKRVRMDEMDSYMMDASDDEMDEDAPEVSSECEELHAKFLESMSLPDAVKDIFLAYSDDEIRAKEIQLQNSAYSAWETHAAKAVRDICKAQPKLNPLEALGEVCERGAFMPKGHNYPMPPRASEYPVDPPSKDQVTGLLLDPAQVEADAKRDQLLVDWGIV